MSTVDDLRKQYPELEGLDDDQTVDAVHAAFYPALDRSVVADKMGVKTAPPPIPNRTMGEAISDTGRSVMSGMAGLVKTGGDLYGLASGDMNNPVGTVAKDAQEYWADGQSPALKAKIAQRKTDIDASPSLIGKFGTAIKDTVTDPALLGDTVFSNVSTLVPGMVAGRVVQGAMTARALAAAGGVLSDAAAAAVGQSIAKVATGVAVGTSAVQQGADVSSQAYDDSMQKTAAQLSTNPEFVKRVQNGEPPRDVAVSLGLSAARAAFLPAVAISVAANAIPGGTMLERALIGGAARDTIKTGEKSVLKSMAKAGLGEAGTETLEEGGGQFAANVAKQQYVDPNQDLSENVGENAGMGAAGGLGVGVPGGAMHSEHGTHAPTGGDHLRQDIQPEIGPLSRGANAGIAVAAAAADAAPPPIAPPARPPAPPAAVAAALLEHANDRARVLDEKAKGTKDESTTDDKGEKIITPGKPAEFLTPEEKDERAFLKEHGGDAKALAAAYPVDPNAVAAATAHEAVPAEAKRELADFDPAENLEQNEYGPFTGAKRAHDGFWLSSDGKHTVVSAGRHGPQVVALDTARFVREHGIGLTHLNAHAIAAFELARDGKDPAGARPAAIKDLDRDFSREKSEMLPSIDAMIAAASRHFSQATAPTNVATNARLASMYPVDPQAVSAAAAHEAAPVAAPAAPALAPSGVPNPAAMTSSGAMPIDTDAALSRIETQGDRDTAAQRSFARAPSFAHPAAAPAPVAAPIINDPGEAPLEGDILNPKGEPFKAKIAAINAQKRQADPASFVIAQVKGGFALRRVAPVAPIASEPIDKEWHAFAPETGTKGIPRADMPQIKAIHRGAMVNFLNARGIAHEAVEIPASALKPTQAEFSPAKVEAAKGFTDTDRSILVSNDGHVLDGHHQWLAKHSAGEPIKAIRLDAPIDKLLPIVREFPSATQADGASNAMPAASERITQLRKKWPGATAESDEYIEALEAWREAKDRLTASGRGGYEAESRIADELIAELGGERGVAADQLGFLREKTKRINTETARINADRNTPGTLANRRQTAADKKAAEDSNASMHKASQQEVEIALKQIREMHAQGRITAADMAELTDIAENAPDSHETASRLHDLLESKVAARDVRTVANKGDAANDAPAAPEGAVARRNRLAEESANRFPPVSQFDEKISVGPGGYIRPRAAAPGKATYRETDVGGLDQMMREDRHAVPFNGFVADTPDLAIGQGMNRGVHVVFRPDAVSGREHSKPATGNLAGREYRTDLLAPRAVQTITMSAADAKKVRGLTRQRMAAEFDREEMGDDQVRFHRKGLERLSPPAPVVDKPAKRKKAATKPEPGGEVLASRGGSTAEAHALKALSENDDPGNTVLRMGREMGYFNKEEVELGLSAKERADKDVQEFIDLDDRTSRAEMDRTPEQWTTEQRSAYRSGDWRTFSELSGYSESEISDFERFMTLAENLDARYGKDFSQGLSHEVAQATAPSAPQTGWSAEALRSAIEPITKAWRNGPKGGVVVVETASKLPPEMLRSTRSSDPSGEARAWFDTKTETAYLIADKLPTLADAQFALFHEVYGHYGMRSILGDSYGPEMMRLRLANPNVAAAASMWFAQYGRQEIASRVAGGMDSLAAERAVRLLSTEEALADRAGADLPLKGWTKTFAKIQQALRAIGLGSVADWLENRTEAETLDFLNKARNAVQMGIPATTQASPTPALASRPLAAAIESGINSVKEVKLPADKLVGDFFNNSGKLDWWSKTVGTMYHLAERHPPFKRVYTATQNFINDVSSYATEAADLAPRILPKMETWKDITKSPLSAGDTKALSAPIFEGTLSWARDEKGQPVKHADLLTKAESMTSEAKARELFRTGNITEQVLKMWQGLPIEQYDSLVSGKYERDVLKAGVVWSDAELKSIFKLSPDQIGLYREFRQSIDKSLTNLAVSDMLRFAGDDVDAATRERVLDLGDVDKAGEALRDALFKRADSDPERKAVLNDTANTMIDKADRANDLMQRGYAPLSRFGSYTLDVVDANGDRVYFSLFESKAERSMMARKMLAEFPKAKIEQGTVSQEAYKLFAGVSPETLELFGGMLGLEAQGDGASNKAFQEYIKVSKANRSAMKRLIERKGIAGFSEDAGRVLAGFVYSNARQTSMNLHAGEVASAIVDIPKQQGELRDAAERLRNYISNPQEEAQGIRGVMFAQYLGGSVASAMVNMTQPVAVTFPYLSQWGGATKAAKQMVAAVRDANRKVTGDKALDAALKHAEDNGIVSPQEVHQLMAQANGRAQLRSGDGTRAGNAMATARNGAAKVLLAWGKVFGVAEQFNRRVTFIAAYRTAVAEKIADPAAFAAKAVVETQFVYNKGNKPQWARGAVGGTLFTFKQYSVNYLEVIHRMWNNGPEGKKAALLMLAVMFLMGGADGLPFAQDLDDVIDGAMQRMGYNFSTNAAKAEFFASVLGKDGGRFIEKGISGLPGVPIDVAGRLGVGNLIPGTGLLTKKVDHTSDMLELLGPAADLAKRSATATGQALTGDIGGALTTIAPTAARNLIQAYDMANTGMYRDQKGRKVIDVDGFDVLSKSIGFQPNDVARVQEATREVQGMVAQAKMRETEIADQWAQAAFEKDAAGVQDAKDTLARWNADNPTSQIKIGMPQIIKRLRAMNEDKATRIAKTAPKEIRQTVKRELADAAQ